MAPENYIILRSSPDWLQFDMEDSREFLRQRHFPEEIVIRFADRADRLFAMSYRMVRHQMKQITLDTIAHARDCRLVSSEGLRNPGDDDVIVFMDDDDWVAPDLFGVLRSTARPGDGYAWGSIRLGLTLAGMKAGNQAILKRKLDDILYTNNYAVTGRALKRLGMPALLENPEARQALHSGQFNPTLVPAYLSCANKHPWCTMVIQKNLECRDFFLNLRIMVETYSAILAKIELDADALWIARYLHGLQSLVARTLGSGGVQPTFGER